MDLGRLIRQNDDLSDVLLNEESLVAAIPGGFLDMSSFSFVLPWSFGSTSAIGLCFIGLFYSNPKTRR